MDECGRGTGPYRTGKQGKYAGGLKCMGSVEPWTIGVYAMSSTFSMSN